MSRWGEYTFCNGCKHQETINFSGYTYGKCNKPYNGKFPDSCEVPERSEIEFLTSNGKRGHINEG